MKKLILEDSHQYLINKGFIMTPTMPQYTLIMNKPESEIQRGIVLRFSDYKNISDVSYYIGRITKTEHPFTMSGLKIEYQEELEQFYYFITGNKL